MNAINEYLIKTYNGHSSSEQMETTIKEGMLTLYPEPVELQTMVFKS